MICQTDFEKQLKDSQSRDLLERFWLCSSCVNCYTVSVASLIKPLFL